MALGIINAFLAPTSPSKPNPDTSAQAEIERQKAIERQQAEEQRKQASRQAASQAWKDLQVAEQDARAFDGQRRLAAGQDLLRKVETVGGGSELRFKTIEADPSRGGAVDLRGLSDKQGVVQLLTSPEQDAARDRWYQERGFTDLAPIPEGGIPDSPLPDSQLEDSKEYKIADAVFDQIAKHPLGALPAYVGKTVLSIENQAFRSITATTDSILNGTPAPEAVTNGTVVQNILFETTKSRTIDALTDAGKSRLEKSGIALVSAKHGDARGADTETILGLADDAQTVWGIWRAPWYRYR